MGTFAKHRWWIVTALITAPLVALAAGVPNVFTPNTVISSAQVNANFTNLADRVTALEATAAKSSASFVMNNLAGLNGVAGLRTATVTASGLNPLLLVVSGSGYSGTVASTLDIAIQFDGVIVGHLAIYTNEVNSHKAFPTRAIPIPTPTAGAHTVGLLAVSPTVTDTNDYFSVTAVELH